MFSLIWGPTLAAVSVILDNASEVSVVRRALDALLLAAKMAAYHQVGQGRDQMLAAGWVARWLHAGAKMAAYHLVWREKA
jgi:hypothetical protein